MKKQPTKQQDVLPDNVTNTLLEATKSVPLATDRVRSLKDNILKLVGKGETVLPADFITIREDEGDWHPLAPKSEIKILRSDAKTRSFLIRMQPGAVLPSHVHPHDEECIMLEGECWIGDLHLKAGDYHFAPKGQDHGEVRSDTGALAYIRGASESQGNNAYRY